MRVELWRRWQGSAAALLGSATSKPMVKLGEHHQAQYRESISKQGLMREEMKSDREAVIEMM